MHFCCCDAYSRDKNKINVFCLVCVSINRNSFYIVSTAIELIKVVGDPCQKITLLLLKSKSVRVIVPESCF